MIVVDTNIIAYLFIPSEFTPKAEKLFKQDSHWIAPVLWRSEFRNVLALYMRKKAITFEQALSIQAEAESLFQDNEYDLPSIKVLSLLKRCACSAYDCEFIALAEMLGLKLFTADKKILKEFKSLAFSL